MSKLIRFINLASKLVDKFVNYLVVGLIGVMVIVITLQVIFRFFFTALSWTEELSRYLLVWCTFFGATLAYKRGGHIAITFVVNKLTHKIKTSVSIFSYFLAIIFFLTVAYYGYQMIKMQTFQISPAMGIPMKYVYLGIPVSLLIMILHTVNGISIVVQKHIGEADVG